MNAKQTKSIFNNPQWYLFFEKEINKYIIQYDSYRENLDKKRLRYYIKEREYFIKRIERNLGLIKSNTDLNEFYFDKNRKKIDTIVIHHSSRNWRTLVSKIESIHLLNLYVREFLSNPTLRGLRLFSGHIYNDKTTFFAYHYIVFRDGNYINPLKDEYIGWHCGNIDFNSRSIAICIHDDLYQKVPNQEIISTVKKIIRKYEVNNILGHCEIKNSTTCPGKKFTGIDGWKNLLY